MKKKVFLFILCGVMILMLIGCDNSTKDENAISNQQNNIKEAESITSNQNDSTEQQNEDNNTSLDDYYIGTYYMVLADGSLADDGTGTIIFNNDMSCTYIYGQSNMGCTSYSVNDHLITLKVSESSSDIYLTLDADNKILIDANNEKYMRK